MGCTIARFPGRNFDKEHDLGRLDVDFVSGPPHEINGQVRETIADRRLLGLRGSGLPGLNRNLQRPDPLVSRPLGRQPMMQNKPAESGEQVPAKPHDSGSAANETDDGLDATTETLRKAAEDTPSGSGRGDIEKTPVFDRADLAPKI
jgi:hypothetical protein